MKKLIRHWIWTFLVATGLDGVVARNSWNTGRQRFIPLSRYYHNRGSRRFNRNGVELDLPLNEYTNWKLFANEPFMAIDLAALSHHEGKSILDIGANSGFFSLSVARKWKDRSGASLPRIFAFEPNPPVFARLSRHLELNPDLEDIIKPCNLGLGTEKSMLEISVPVRNSGLGSFVRFQEEKASEPMKTERVPVESLDEFWAQQQAPPISFCKLDVECFEAFVLKGGIQTIQIQQPCFQVEYSDGCTQYHDFGERFTMRFFKDPPV